MIKEYKHFKKGYYVSNYGKVKRVRNNKKYDVKLLISEKGYYYFILLNNDNERKYLHRAIAEIFLPKVKGKNIVDHIDGNRKNNNVLNFRWVSTSENSLNRKCHRNY